jgi:CxxC motif-containing protein
MMVEVKFPEQFTKHEHMEPVNDNEVKDMIKECLESLGKSNLEASVETGDTIVEVIKSCDYYKIVVTKKMVYYHAFIDREATPSP